MRPLIVNNYVFKTPILDIIELLRNTLTNGKLRDVKQSHDNLVVTCPFHGDGLEHTPACNIYIGDNEKLPFGYFRCLVCETSGSFLKFAAGCFDKSEDYAQNWLLENFEHELLKQQIQLGDDIVLHKQNTVKKLDSSILDTYQAWHPYLAQRKISRAICEEFNVKYDPVHRQIVFPCYDIKGNLVMCARRSIDSKVFYMDKDVEKPVYCLDKVLKSGSTQAIITEGPIDCLTGWTYGMPTCATLGAISDKQIDVLSHSGLNIIYSMFDNDAAGKSFTEKLKSRLNKRILIVDVKIPNGYKDINDLDRNLFIKCLEEAKN